MKTSPPKSARVGRAPPRAISTEVTVAAKISRNKKDRRIRQAFVLRIKPESAAEYQRRHEAIWPELVATLKAHGVHNYSIFRCESSLLLFAYVEVEDIKHWEAVGRTKIGRRWRKHMSDLLVTNADFSPMATSLTEVFHLA